eukprot:UC4_evm1s891
MVKLCWSAGIVEGELVKDVEGEFKANVEGIDDGATAGPRVDSVEGFKEGRLVG